MSKWDQIMRYAPAHTQAEASFEKYMTDMLANGFLQPGDRALDIGSGKSARHTIFMQQAGFVVTAIDITPESLANHHVSWKDYVVKEKFKLIVDIKTLCHEEFPELDKVFDSLTEDGLFYSMLPTFRHKIEKYMFDVGKGKEFTRYPDEDEIRSLFAPFPIIIARELREPIGRMQHLSTWCIEAYKDGGLKG